MKLFSVIQIKGNKISLKCGIIFNGPFIVCLEIDLFSFSCAMQYHSDTFQLEKKPKTF